MLDPWPLEAASPLRKKVYLALRLRTCLDRAAYVHCTTPLERDNVKKLRVRSPLLVEPNGVNLSDYLAPAERGRFRGRHLGGFAGPLF